MRRPRVLVLHVGGTIGMAPSPDGYRTKVGHLAGLLAGLPQLAAPDMPVIEVVELDPLLDSADMNPSDWKRIAMAIAEHDQTCDGFLVLHGTDTMAYTAAALSFMLEGLSKPVILTGAQIPLAAPRTDALGNLLTSLAIIARFHTRLGEVFICFDDLLLRGNRTSKLDADTFRAFDSPNLAPVGRAGVDLEIDWTLVRPVMPGCLRVVPIGSATVGAFRIFPGLRPEFLENLLAPPVQGIVLECYGSGNAPARNAGFMEALARAVDRGVVVVAVTQPPRGTADLGRYATGQALARIGIVPGYDMTTEAALAKLTYLFECGNQATEVKRLMQLDLRGEMSAPEPVWA